jgi:hypothetical protein
VDAGGNAVHRIGTTDSTVVVLEDCNGCSLQGWGWQDNGYGAGVLGPPIYFAQAGAQTIRIQTREDGLRIDQVVLSPKKYLTTAPGALRNDATILPESSVGAPANQASANQASWWVAFTASADHTSNVTSYRLEVFAGGADPNTATPVAASDLGKPALNANGEIILDRTSFFEALAAGNYVMTVRAIGNGGSTRSAPYSFLR